MTSTVDMPSGTDFTVNGGSCAINSGAATFSAMRIGEENGNGVRFEGSGADSDSLTDNDQRHLWFYFRTPESTTDGVTKSIYVTLTATRTSM